MISPLRACMKRVRFAQRLSPQRGEATFVLRSLRRALLPRNDNNNLFKQPLIPWLALSNAPYQQHYVSPICCLNHSEGTFSGCRSYSSLRTPDSRLFRTFQRHPASHRLVGFDSFKRPYALAMVSASDRHSSCACSSGTPLNQKFRANR